MPHRKIPRPAKITDAYDLRHYTNMRMYSIEHVGATLVKLLERIKHQPNLAPGLSERAELARKSLLESVRDLAIMGGLNMAELEALRQLNRAINNKDPVALRRVINQYTCLLKKSH